MANTITRILLIGMAAFTCLSALSQKLNLVQIATGFSNPVDIKNCGDNRIFVVEQSGLIRIMNKTGNINATPFLSLVGKVLVGSEQGVLSLAFSPNYKQDGYFYVNYCAGSGNGVTRISRFQVDPADSNLALPASEKILLTFSHPNTNHKGASLMFGADGYLYDTQGDGGGTGDPSANGQNLNTYLGKILRLDVSNPDTTYTIPSTNPFYGQINRKGEIWAFGVRNPWRCSFDRITHDLWIGEVGQGNYEEVDYQRANSTGGENYGWRCYEGYHTYNNSGCTGITHTPPIYEYEHVGGACSITGGYVYRGTRYAGLWGLYLFADYCSGNFRALDQVTTNNFALYTLQTFSTLQYSSFGEDNYGELYVAARGLGRIYRIADTSTCNPVAFISLNDTISGCLPFTVQALNGDSLSYQWYNTNGLVANAASYQFQPQESGWYKVKVSKAQVGCEAISDSVFINDNNTKLSIVNPELATCNNQGPISIASNISPAGGIFFGLGITETEFNPVEANIGSNDITYDYTNSNNCTTSATFDIQVSDTTMLTTTVADSSVCSTTETIQLNGMVLPLGGVYSGNGVSEDSLFVPAAAGMGTTPVSYHYTADGCNSTIAIAITVNDTTILEQHLTPVNYCTNSGPVLLGEFITPTGGTYSGNGVTGNSFSPDVAGVGDHTLVYSYNNNAGCSSENAFILTVSVCTGMEESSNNGFSFTIYPNPNNGSFEVLANTGAGQLINADVIDGLGRVCFAKSVSVNGPTRIPFQLSQLPKAVYTVRMKGRDEVSTARLVIN